MCETMKYDFESIVDRDPAVRGTGKYNIMHNSKGNPPEGYGSSVCCRHGILHCSLHRGGH